MQEHPTLFQTVAQAFALKHVSIRRWIRIPPTNNKQLKTATEGHVEHYVTDISPTEDLWRVRTAFITSDQLVIRVIFYTSICDISATDQELPGVPEPYNVAEQFSHPVANCVDAIDKPKRDRGYHLSSSVDDEENIDGEWDRCVQLWEFFLMCC